MPAYVDLHVPEHIMAKVVVGDILEGKPVFLSGAEGVSIQLDMKNGAAGAIEVFCTSQQGKKPRWVSFTQATIAANETRMFTYSLTTGLTAAHMMYCKFTATAPGDAQISVNVRRTTY